MDKTITDLWKQLEKSLNCEDSDNLADLLNRAHPGDIARLLKNLPLKRRCQLFKAIPEPSKTAVIALLPAGLFVRLVQEIPHMGVSDYLPQLPLDKAVDAFLILGREEQERLLADLTDPRLRLDLIDLGAYPTNSAGAVMTADYLGLDENSTVDDSLEILKNAEYMTGRSNYLYTVDEDACLTGAIPLKSLLGAAPFKRLRDFIDPEPFRVRVDSPIPAVVEKMEKYNLFELPVIDYQGRLAGVITPRIYRELLEHRHICSHLRLQGISLLDYDFCPVRETTSFWNNLALRLPWLVIVALGGFLMAAIFYYFYRPEPVENYFIYFIPLILALSGLTARQTTACTDQMSRLVDSSRETIIRKLVVHPLYTALGPGVFLGFLTGASLWCWKVYRLGWSTTGASLIGSVGVGLALLSTIFMATFVGSIVPFLIEKIAIDPDRASGPLLDLLAALSGLSVFLWIVSLFV